MPVVTVNPNDVTGTALPASAALRVVYKLSGLASGGGFAFVTKPVYAYPDPVTNIASVGLVALDNLKPADLFYRVTIEYLDPNAYAPNQGYQVWDEFSADLYLGQTGGNLPDLLSLRTRPDQWFTSDVAAVPAGSQSGDWLLVTTTDDVYRIR